jgi:hypothetical protein
MSSMRAHGVCGDQTRVRACAAARAPAIDLGVIAIGVQADAQASIARDA